MTQEGDLKALGKVIDFMRGISAMFLLINCYWFCYKTFHAWGFTLGIIDEILMSFQRTTGLFSFTLWTKLFCAIFLVLFCLGTKGMKKEKITWPKIWVVLFSGLALHFLNWRLLVLPIGKIGAISFHIFMLSVGYICLLMDGVQMNRLLRSSLMNDVFSIKSESFMQETQLMENEYFVNLPTCFYYKKRWNNGWINVVNPFRASMVLGTLGSGRPYAIVNNYTKQQIGKGFTICIYDYKFPDLSGITCSHLFHHLDAYKVEPQFFVINFGGLRRNRRRDPINPTFMTDISDTYESVYTIMPDLNHLWIQEQGDFFVRPSIILLVTIVWFLKIYKDREYCTFPHTIEFLSRPHAQIFPILTSYDGPASYLSPFVSTWEGGAQNRLQEQMASVRILLSRMISPVLYWVMTDDDFSLGINNPNESKVPIAGNNPDRQSIYSAALKLYNSRIIKLVNKKRQLKSSVIIDELPTIYFRGLGSLIATARSNKVAIYLDFQDFSQLTHDYGGREGKVVQNTVGSVFSGRAVGEIAKTPSERFGKVLQQR